MALQAQFAQGLTLGLGQHTVGHDIANFYRVSVAAKARDLDVQHAQIDLGRRWREELEIGVHADRLHATCDEAF